MGKSETGLKNNRFHLLAEEDVVDEVVKICDDKKKW